MAGRLGRTKRCVGLALLVGWIVWLHVPASRYEGWLRLLIELGRWCVCVWTTLFALDVCLEAALQQLHA